MERDEDRRPDPERLLRLVKREEAAEQKKKRGKLSIFLGYAAGVGKTYAMLDAAHTAKKNGVDVVEAYIEPHERPETRAMAEGLEAIPTLEIAYKGITLHEMDLDAVLKRKPQLALVDELAHTNAPGMRHQKRYEDIEELLAAGIDVWTTVNIQHLESLNDLVGGITAIRVQERVPDTFFDSADRVKLIDIEPEQLIERLKEGKVYRSAQASRALGHFFSKEKLAALREIALRRMADRVNRIAIEEHQAGRDAAMFYAGEHVMTCISPSPSCAKVIRSASRLAQAFHARFTALYVETPGLQNAEPKVKKMVEDNMHLAEQLGAKVATVFGEDVPFQIAEYAKVSSVTKIVLGRTNHRIMFGQKRGTLADEITQYLPDMDIYIIPDTRRDPWSPSGRQVIKYSKPEDVGSIMWDLGKAVLALGGATAAGLTADRIGFMSANIILVYLTAILLLSLFAKRRWVPATASLVSVLLFNYFFVPPLHSLSVDSPLYYSTFVFMFFFAFMFSSVIGSERMHVKESAKLAYRTELLLENSKRMRRVHSVKDLMNELSGQVMKLMNLSVIFFVGNEGKLAGPWLFPRQGVDKEMLRTLVTDQERTVAGWVLANGKRAGCCTHTLPGANAMYLPIKTSDEVYAVMGIVLEQKREIPPFEYGLLSAMLNEAALVFARIYQTDKVADQHK